MATQITTESLTVVSHSDVPVITTELLARLYGTPSHSITKNHRSNVGRFVVGKHYYKVAGQELATLRVTFGDLQISPKARSLILWTERGAARHAKMLETDQAWEVFEKLEDSYFSQGRGEANDNHMEFRHFVMKDMEITQLNALFFCAEHLRTEMWPHLTELLPSMNSDYKETFSTLAMVSQLLKRKREECQLKAERIMKQDLSGIDK